MSLCDVTFHRRKLTAVRSRVQTNITIVVPSLFGALCGGSGTPCGGSSRGR